MTKAPNPPLAPQVGGQAVLGTYQVSVDRSGEVTMAPIAGPFGARVGDVSAQVYGTQNVDVRVYSSPVIINPSGSTTTWILPIGLRNLLSFPIGSNQGGALPFDTMGVYLGVIGGPTVTATSSTCKAPCTVSVTGFDGTGFLTAANQPFLYWEERPTAVQTPAGTDTVSARHNLTFVGPNEVTNFTFVLIVSAAWPPGNGQTFWPVAYNAQLDTLPDVNAKPKWKQGSIFGGGTETPPGKNGTTLTLSATGGNHKKNATLSDIYLFRFDSLDQATPAFIDATLDVSNKNDSPTSPATVLGLQDGVAMAVAGVQETAVGFVEFDPLSLTWQFVPGTPTFTLDATVPHEYRVRKFGADSATIEVDGTRQVGVTYAQLPLLSTFIAPTVRQFFGVAGGTFGSSLTLWSQVSYGIGQTTP